MDDTITSKPNYSIRRYYEKNSAWWQQEKERTSLNLFKRASEQVPAYKDFLSRYNIDPKKIATASDLQYVPPITKDNYLRRYPLESLCWQGTLDTQLLYCATSGSTGRPFYFPRNQILDWQNSYVLENFLNQSQCEGPILAVICFGMGVWIGGVLNYSAFQILQGRDSRSISVIAPGINKPEILQVLLTLAPKYREVVLLGYPPFIKDLFDTCNQSGIKLDQLNFKLIFAAECISENFRDHICEMAGIGNPLRDMINIYGSADIGGMAIENAAGIALRRLTRSNGKLQSEFFPTAKNATVAQYNPHFISFDCHDNSLLISGDSALPLIRYSLGDRGGLFSYDKAVDVCDDYQLSLIEFAFDEGVQQLEQLPFVYVYEREDFSVKFYGAIIFPDHIRAVIQDKNHVDHLTGRFCIEVGETEQRDQQLIVNIELKSKVAATVYLESTLVGEIKGALIKNSSEFANNAGVLGDKVTPLVRFWPYGHEKYFKLGIKQKWVKKTAPIA